MRTVLLSIIALLTAASAQALSFPSASPVPLQFMRILNGSPQSGLSITVAVKDVLSGSTLLSTTSLVETPGGSGNYVYTWNHGIDTTRQCQAIYTVSGSVFVEPFTIDGTDNQIESNQGQTK